MPRNPSARQGASSRLNGRRGGRPRRDKLTAEQVREALVQLAAERFKVERPENLQFLIDLRDGLVPGATAQDRLRAVESMLDRDPVTARAKPEVATPDEKSTRKLVEMQPGPEYEAPAGWLEKPIEMDAHTDDGSSAEAGASTEHQTPVTPDPTQAADSPGEAGPGQTIEGQPS